MRLVATLGVPHRDWPVGRRTLPLGAFWAPFDVFDGAQPAPSSSVRPLPIRRRPAFVATDSIVQTIDPAHLAANQLAPPVHVKQHVADRKSYSPAADLRFRRTLVTFRSTTPH